MERHSKSYAANAGIEAAKGGEIPMDIDDFFDDDFSAEEGVIIGGFFGMVEEEDEDERRRKKLERELINPNDYDRHRDDEEDYL